VDYRTWKFNEVWGNLVFVCGSCPLLCAFAPLREKLDFEPLTKDSEGSEVLLSAKKQRAWPSRVMRIRRTAGTSREEIFPTGLTRISNRR
jgi:hypothetical protein